MSDYESAPAASVYGLGHEDWGRSAAELTQALREIALECGDEEFADGIAIEASQPDSAWPAVSAVRRLEETYPGAIAEVVIRKREIREANIKRDRQEPFRHPIRWLGKAGLGRLRLYMAGASTIGEGMSNFDTSGSKSHDR